MPRKIGYALLLLLLGIANFFVFLYNRSRNEPPPAGLANTPSDFGSDDPRSSILSEWHAEQAIPLTSDTVSSALEARLSDACLKPPVGVTAVLAASISASQRAELVRAVTGLVLAYAADSPGAVVEYMADRGESLAPGMMELKRQHYRKKHSLTNDAAVPPDMEVWEFYWNDWGYGAHWDGFIPGGTCFTFFRCQGSQAGPIAAGGTLTGDSIGIWRNVTTIPHHFAPVDGREFKKEAVSPSGALVTDVRIVIAHSDEVYGQRSPYYLRFWYNTMDQRWHPLLLCRARIDVTEQDKVKILF